MEALLRQIMVDVEKSTRALPHRQGAFPLNAKSSSSWKKALIALSCEEAGSVFKRSWSMQ